MFSFLFQIALILILPCYYMALGGVMLSLIRRFFPATAGDAAELDDSWSRTTIWILGLLLHLSAVTALKLLHFPWNLATFLPLFLVLIDFPAAMRAFFSVRLNLSINFTLWFAVVLMLGATLFDTAQGIATPWVNNYGDFAWHVGMITSFVFGDNFPPQYHIYPGETLSYPFFINLWSAVLWWPHPSFYSLTMIFVFQWTALWCAVYFLVRGNKFLLAPWAILFAGGAYLRILHWLFPERVHTEIPAHLFELLGKKYPWTAFIDTIWVTQRSALFGTCLVLAAANLFHEFLRPDERVIRDRNVRLACAGVLLSFCTLVHTHFMAACVAYMGVCLLIGAGYYLLGQRKEDGVAPIHLVIFALSLVPLLLGLPWIVGKAGTLSFAYGWMPWTTADGKPYFLGAVLMWLNNAPCWLALIVLLWVLSRRHLELFSLSVVFVAANLLQLAIWSWDQLKVFIALYLIFICLWTHTSSRRLFYAHLLFLFLIPPALLETYIVFNKFQDYTVYSTEDLTVAQGVRDNTPPEAIVLGAPNHNSPITLTGRTLYCGYDGTLSSHGIDYGKRKEEVTALEPAVRCRETQRDEAGVIDTCPTYLLWTQREKEFWKRESPPVLPMLKPTAVPFLYRIE